VVTEQLGANQGEAAKVGVGPVETEMTDSTARIHKQASRPTRTGLLLRTTVGRLV
jgi:hypothetical protein